MSVSYPEFKLATRGSRLALVQADEATKIIGGVLPCARFVPLVCATPGDRDKKTDLRNSAPDFFTRDLHLSVMSGRTDCAVHSAKDLEDKLPEGMDWFWLPEPADSRDVLILREGETIDGLDNGGIAGVSSDRREAYCRRYLPRLRIRSIRGTIEERLALLDAGRYDALVMAAAALQRLDMHDRISHWIPLSELMPPEGQGCLALTFRSGDERFLGMRGLFVKPVVFAGAGSGSSDTCTLGAFNALLRCDVCVHDGLLDASLLDCLPPEAQRVDAGKRRGLHKLSQPGINALLAAAARRGRRVVRLKGGDPGIFGRLAEEIEALDALRLPYRVIPGVSSLTVATTGTGMLLTRRGVSRGFTVITPRQQDGKIAPIGAEARAALPMAFFMGTVVIDEIVKQLASDGLPETTPVAVVFDAGSTDETIVRGSLKDIVARLVPSMPHPTSDSGCLSTESRPGLILVGDLASHGYRWEWGALAGKRILLPGSDALANKSANVVRDFGGVPVPVTLIKMIPEPACIPILKTLGQFNWLAVTSPSSVNMLMQLLPDAGVDVRELPKIVVAGSGTAQAFRRFGIVPDLTPDRDFGVRGIMEAARQSIPPDAMILRIRSHLAGAGLARALTDAGFCVTDCVAYRNKINRPERIPGFDAVFFASASAVDAFFELQSPEALAGKPIAAIGRLTLAALEKHGLRATVHPDATVESAIRALASEIRRQAMEKLV